MAGIRIGVREFKTKKSAKDHIRQIVASHQDGDFLSGGAFVFIRDLLDLHPEADDKIGCGVLAISVNRNPVYPSTRGFILHRHDDTHTDFSWLACIDGRTIRQDILAAMRFEIASQVIAFKALALISEAYCPYRGTPLTQANSHVDHEPPKTFAALVESWLDREGLMMIEGVEISPSADNQYVARMANGGQRKSWTEFHATEANLRLLSRTANLSDVKRGLHDC